MNSAIHLNKYVTEKLEIFLELGLKNMNPTNSIRYKQF